MIIFVSAAAVVVVVAALLTVILLKNINNGTNAFVPGINSLDPYTNNSNLRPSTYLKAGITINGFSLVQTFRLPMNNSKKDWISKIV